MIVASGWIREETKKWDRTYIFCKPHNINNIAFLYRDEPKIKLLAMDDVGVQSFMRFNPDNNYKMVGFSEYSRRYNNSLSHIDEIMYGIAGYPLEIKWSGFKIQRDLEAEDKVMDTLGLKPGDPYIFIHDDEKRRITRVKPTMRVIKSDKSIPLFHYIKVLENAKEAHILPSAFCCLFDVMNIEGPELFIHTYPVEGFNDRLNNKFRRPFKILR